MSKLDWALGITVLIAVVTVLVDIVLLGCAYFISVQFIKPFVICYIVAFIFAIIGMILGVISVKKNKG